MEGFELTGFSIIMPAFHAAATIAQSVGSVLNGTFADFELLLIADDAADYRQALADSGISDPRLRYLQSGGVGTGSSHARNVGLDAAQYDFIAILDADDLFLDDKLQRIAPLVERYGFVSTALDVREAGRGHLRNVGAGEDKALTPAAYKFTNVSMDSMIAYDRRIIDPRYDESQDCLTDLDLILKLFAGFATCFHSGVPLHAYVKQSRSISIGTGASDRYRRMKRTLIERLESGHYPMRDPAGPEGFVRFLQASLRAEESFERAKLERPGLIFEDHLEPYLSSA
ncbi:MAG: glycosyltransferase family 2 protein [Hyphomicrobiaceae bacterium]|nr:glycosyltransferase family 2 protein [Hyphomicrobiaceae bacterium]MCC0023949.1 glycosyltransferase family 2 protein [Hyphomicrobiaceae bacterium]